MSKEGYIKLHRQIMEWEWYNNISTKVLFLHCLLRANHAEKKWQGVVIKKGSFITSYEILAFETGLTVKQVRTALNKLKMTGEVAHQTTSHYSIITINNWDKFQIEGKQEDTQRASEGQAEGRQRATNNNDKNDNNEKNVFLLEQKPKKLDPYINPIKTYFLEEYEKEFRTIPRLSSFECNRLVELAADNSDIRELIPEAIKRLKRIKFDDIQFTPTASWLLKSNNFERVINGEFEPKKTQAELYRERRKECENS